MEGITVPRHIPIPVSKHTELTNKEVAGVIDHADLSVTDEKLESGVGLSDTQICKLPVATEDKVLKRGAAAWEAGDVPAPTLEGDFSDWSIYDSFDDTDVDVYSWHQYAVVNKAETIIALIFRVAAGLKKYTIATKVLGLLQSAYWFPGFYAAVDSGEGVAHSIQGTYVVGMVQVLYGEGNGIAVWKNGDLIKSMTAADLGFTANKVYGVCISRSGKYIVVCGERSATTTNGWVILEGS